MRLFPKNQPDFCTGPHFFPVWRAFRAMPGKESRPA
jgi:hypothetical protein